MSLTSQYEKPLLTPRQLEVLEFMAAGLPNREIAEALRISPATVKRHVSAVIAALDVTNRTEAATRLHELGLGAAPKDDDFTVPGFGSRPAIAVLPFDNLSGDPQLTYLADGFTEDLITRLAQWRWFPVIARNSTFAYRGKAVDVKEVSETLGARYVVEGSFRPMASHMRITVQVIDGRSGRHVGAHTYDRELAELAAVQDEIVDTVVATLEPALLRIEGLHVLAQPSKRIDGWDATQAAWALASRNTPQGYLEGAVMADRALDIDPELAAASGVLSLCQFNLSLLGRSSGGVDPIERLYQVGRQALETDEQEPYAHVALGFAGVLSGDREGARTSTDRAVELAPSSPGTLVARAIVLMANGCHEEAVLDGARAIRLSPLDPILPTYRLVYGLALLGAGRFEEARTELEATVSGAPDLPFGHSSLAALHYLAGNVDRARELFAQMAEIDPHYSPLLAARIFGGGEESAAFMQQMLDELRA